ncbi:cell division protein ZapD [Salinisphaera japonica]|uniref:Cell division protein ZapD n=1 Tax=Salinisphaera japonica YTM-1 TaxID=1209778 RepID=A0A423PSH6_9GAMM|nr:cell division protein ZapD [Salinisphaera japonica]ROO28471.1 hypothetical protein SAJA_07940 [Salinisphaera japonica YTM-1]
MVDDDLSCYEQPLNERIRTFLRVEHLLTRLSHHRADTSHWGRRATVEATLDLLNVMSRHDIRGEASKALVTRRGTLAALAERDDIDTRALTDILAEIDARAGELARIPPQFAAYRLRDDELLKSVNNRTAIAGGTCSFDVPAYRHWLRQSDARITADIDRWIAPIETIGAGVGLVLRMLREASTADAYTAKSGVFLHQTASNTQLIRVFVADDDVFPEISAGRHRATVRFMCDVDGRSRQASRDVDFHMACSRL